MQVTFILRNLSETFFEGLGDSIIGLDNLEPRARFDTLARHAKGDLKHCVSMKAGSGQFRDHVELNQLLRGPVSIDYKIEPRRGYKLATFTISKA